MLSNIVDGRAHGFNLCGEQHPPELQIACPPTQKSHCYSLIQQVNAWTKLHSIYEEICCGIIYTSNSRSLETANRGLVKTFLWFKSPRAPVAVGVGRTGVEGGCAFAFLYGIFPLCLSGQNARQQNKCALCLSFLISKKEMMILLGLHELIHVNA